jgi:hypothetical protein
MRLETIYRQIAGNLRGGHLPPPLILLGELGVLLGITARHRK